MQSEENDLFFINEEEAGERLDKILAKRLKDLGSRTYFQFLIEEQRVLLNGMPVKKRMAPAAGDEIEIQYISAPELSIAPENIPLDIIYEDEHLLVVNKKPGMVVHPALGNWSGTFVNALLYHCKNQGQFDASLRPGIVHRLDKETSGLLIAAKNGNVQQQLIEQFAARQVYKEYLAICMGNPGKGTINAPIGRHPIQRKQMAVVETGREAITHFETICFSEKISLVRLVIATGRTHQIRVHMKHCNSPVLGDALYGNSQFNKKFQAQRQMLHAHRLKFIHPVMQQVLEFSTEPPEDMKNLLHHNHLLY